jgi:hypothetical protein
MKYYSEEDTKELRLALEDEVLSWPQIGTRKMYGCPCYKAYGKLFAFLVTKGLVLLHLTENDKEKISRQYQTSPFQAGRMTIQGWVRIPIEDKRELGKIMLFVKKSYRAALKKAKD